MRVLQTNAAWQVLSASANVAFQVTGASPVEIGLSNVSAGPISGFIYSPGFGDRGAVTELFPSASGNTVWARSSAPSVVVIG